MDIVILHHAGHPMWNFERFSNLGDLTVSRLMIGTSSLLYLETDTALANENHACSSPSRFRKHAYEDFA